MKIYGGNFRKIHNFHENFRFFSGCGENNNYYMWAVIGVVGPPKLEIFSIILSKKLNCKIGKSKKISKF